MRGLTSASAARCRFAVAALQVEGVQRCDGSSSALQVDVHGGNEGAVRRFRPEMYILDDSLYVPGVLVVGGAGVCAVLDGVCRVGVDFFFDERFEADHTNVALVALTQHDVLIVHQESL